MSSMTGPHAGFDSARRVMSGTWGELWLDDELVAEIYKFQAKVTLNKENVAMCGVMWTDHKVKSIEGKGSMGMYKVSSRMVAKIGATIKRGQDPRFTAISKLDDPDAYGAERIAVYNVSFDDLTLADWEAGVFGKVECPFTFNGFDLLDAA